MDWLWLIPTLTIGYLLGSINFSIVITKTVGKFDIHQKGSGNAGGTNVARTMGAKWGILVIAMEILKSTAFGLISKFVFPADLFGWGEVGQCLSAAVAILGCLIGNMYPCFHGFKGGKGVTTGAALMVVLQWWMFPTLLVIFIIEFLCTKFVSVCSITAAIGVIVLSGIYFLPKEYGWTVFCVATVIALVVIWNHRGNIKRLLNGTENKMNLGKKKQ